jgi:septum formation protein
VLKRLILASASPRRAQLLTQIGLEFIAVTSGYAEREIRSVADVEEMALAKARTVYGSFSDDLILGADTAVFLAGDAFGKPRDEKDAVEMLKLLSGQVHSVVTGLALINGSREVTGWEKTLVKMRPLEEQEIKAYVATGEPMDKAGAYGAQGRAAIFVERVEGCYFNVVGLPLARLAAMLQSEGLPVWER